MPVVTVVPWPGPRMTSGSMKSFQIQTPRKINTLAVAVTEEAETVEDVYEPFLLKEGMLQRTPRGRVATAAAYAHLGLDVPSETAGGPSLFEP